MQGRRPKAEAAKPTKVESAVAMVAGLRRSIAIEQVAISIKGVARRKQYDNSSLGNIAPAEFERRWRTEVHTKDQDVAHAKHRVTHRRPVPGSSQATEPAVRG